MAKPIWQFCVALSNDPVFNNNYYHCFLILVVWPRIMSDFWNTVIHCIDVNNLKEQPLEGEQCVFLEKYPDPHHGGNWKFWTQGLGAQRPRKFQWGEGFEDSNSLPGGHNDCFSPTFVGSSFPFIVHVAFFLPCFSSKWLFFF